MSSEIKIRDANGCADCHAAPLVRDSRICAGVPVPSFCYLYRDGVGVRH